MTKQKKVAYMKSLFLISLNIGQGLNNNRTGSADGVETAEQIKERIYQSLKDDIMNR